MVGKSGQPFKKSRNYGESADDLQDRLDLVAALLALADEEITIPSDSLKAQFKLEWVKENELRVSGTVEQKQRNGQRKRTEKGITQDDLGVLLETYRQGKILAAARKEIIQNALSCLRDLEILQEHQSAKNQGYWKFSLCLKHQTAKREDNLQVIQDKWQEAFGQLPELKPLTPTTATLQRCILGLRGNYQDAQQKLAEICHVLQTRFKDKTLSITKVEQGSIILIVESSQTGYEQFKRLIGQEIAGFAVDYAIDEWQAICRQMLIDRKPLTSNTVIGRVYGDRNLIDEDLFVDLALVKPKRSENEKYGQDIDPERGSDLFAQQEETVEKRFAYREFLDEIIGKRTEKQMAIIGEPGAGKTTLLQKLAFWLLQQTDDLVIWVDLAELGNQLLGEYLDQKWLKEALGKSREEIKADWEQKFKGGAVWLLLDGLDEMSQTDQQALKFRGWVTDARTIVTCRLNLWQANPSQLQGFQTYLTQPFQDEQVQEFIQRWFRVEAEAESLWSQLQAVGKERIKDLCRNPLRLTLLCATWKVYSALPETTAELYEIFVNFIYNWKGEEFLLTDEEKDKLTDEKKYKLIDKIKDDLNATLGELAKVSLDGEVSRFRLTHRLVCQYLGKPKAKSSLLNRALKLGWLNEVGVAAENRREKVYTFYHATFQEYFAALAVEDWDYFLPRNHVDCPVEGKRYRIFEPQWKQVILLWLGRGDVPGKEAFIEKLVNFEDECQGLYTYQAYFLAAAGISEFKSYSLGAGVIRQVFQWSFGRFDERNQNWVIDVEFIQQNAWQSLYESDWKLVIQAVADRLEHPKYYEPERRFVIEILEEIGQGDSQAIAILLDYLQVTDDVEYGASVAAFTLSFIGQGSPYAIASFRKALENTNKKDVKKWGNYCLQQIEEDPSVAFEHLLDLLRQERDDLGNSLHRWIDLVAAFTFDHLEQENSFKLVPQILQALPLAQKSPFISWRLTKSLGYLGRYNFDVTLKLIEIFKNTNDEVIRRCAVASLEEVGLGNEDVITNLSEKLPEIKDKSTYSQIFETLTKIIPEEPEIIPGFLRTVLNAEESPSRDQWMDVLENMILRVNKFTEMEIITTLFDILENAKNDSLRWQAANYLADLGQNRFDVIERLLRLLQPGVDKNLHLLEAIVFCLEQIISTNRQSSEVITTLSSFYRDKTHQNNSNLLQAYHKLLWNISRRFFYTDFHQAWHHPPTTPHPEITDQTPHNSETSFATPFTCESLKHLPIYCLNAQPLANETREGEIALTLCRLIWKQVCPQQMYPRVSTPADLCYAIDELKFTLNLPHRALLLTDCEHPTPELISFCETLTGVIAIAFLTDDPLDAPLKGFPPNQPNLISAIETWLEEI